MEGPKRARTDSPEEEANVKGGSFNLVYPFNKRESYTFTPPFINIGNGLDIANLTLGLKLGGGLFFDEQGKISVIGAQNFSVSSPLVYERGTLKLKFANELNLNGDGALTGLKPVFPLEAKEEKMTVAISHGLRLNSLGITLALDPILEFDSEVFRLRCAVPFSKKDNILQLDVGNGLGIVNSQLQCTVNCVPPLRRFFDSLYLNLGYGFKVFNNDLNLKLMPPLFANAYGLQVNVNHPLQVLDNRLALKYDELSPLQVHQEKGLTLQLDDSLTTINSKLAVKVPDHGCLEISPDGLEIRVGNEFDDSRGYLRFEPKVLDGNFRAKTGSRLPFKFTTMGNIKILVLVNVPEVLPTMEVGATRVNPSNLVLQAGDFASTNLNGGTLLVPLTSTVEIGIASTSAVVEITTSTSVQREHAVLTIYDFEEKPYLMVQRAVSTAGTLLSMRILSVPHFISVF